MRKAYMFLILGIWIVILPYLGFPYWSKDLLTTVSGLLLIYLSYVLYKECKAKQGKQEKTFDNFKENNFSN